MSPFAVAFAACFAAVLALLASPVAAEFVPPYYCQPTADSLAFCLMHNGIASPECCPLKQDFAWRCLSTSDTGSSFTMADIMVTAHNNATLFGMHTSKLLASLVADEGCRPFYSYKCNPAAANFLACTAGEQYGTMSLEGTVSMPSDLSGGFDLYLKWTFGYTYTAYLRARQYMDVSNMDNEGWITFYPYTFHEDHAIAFQTRYSAPYPSPLDANVMWVNQTVRVVFAKSEDGDYPAAAYVPWNLVFSAYTPGISADQNVRLSFTTETPPRFPESTIDFGSKCCSVFAHYARDVVCHGYDFGYNPMTADPSTFSSSPAGYTYAYPMAPGSMDKADIGFLLPRASEEVHKYAKHYASQCRRGPEAPCATAWSSALNTLNLAANPTPLPDSAGCIAVRVANGFCGWKKWESSMEFLFTYNVTEDKMTNALQACGIPLDSANDWPCSDRVIPGMYQINGQVVTTMCSGSACDYPAYTFNGMSYYWPGTAASHPEAYRAVYDSDCQEGTSGPGCCTHGGASSYAGSGYSSSSTGSSMH